MVERITSSSTSNHLFSFNQLFVLKINKKFINYNNSYKTNQSINYRIRTIDWDVQRDSQRLIAHIFILIWLQVFQSLLNSEMRSELSWNNVK